MKNKLLNNVASDQQRVRSNSTSTVFLKNTVTKPDVKELITCFALAIQEKLDQAKDATYNNLDDMFDERRYGGKLGEFPDNLTVRSYTNRVFREAEVGEEVIVMAEVYLNRLLTKDATLMMRTSNWRLLLLASFLLASKVWEEEAVWNEDFLILFPSISVKQFAKLEMHMLNKLSFEVAVKASDYTIAYFKLTSRAPTTRKYKDRPLSKGEAERLEIRTLNFADNASSKLKKEVRRPRGQSDASHKKLSSPKIILG